MATVLGQEEKNRDEDHDSQLTVQGVRPDGNRVHLQAWFLGTQHLALEVDTSIFPLDCVFRAGYKFTDRAFVFLSWGSREAGLLSVVLASKSPNDELGSLLGAFANELLDQRIREMIEKEFGDLRTLITAQAFSEGNLLDPNRDEQDYRLDPRGIGRIR